MFACRILTLVLARLIIKDLLRPRFTIQVLAGPAELATTLGQLDNTCAEVTGALSPQGQKTSNSAIHTRMNPRTKRMLRRANISRFNLLTKITVFVSERNL